MKKKKNPMWWGMALVTILGGLYYLGNGLAHLLPYFGATDPEIQGRQLQLFGVNIMIAIPFWLIACASARILRPGFPQTPYRMVHGITALVVAFFILANLYAIYAG